MSFWTALGHDLKIVGEDALKIAPIAGTAVGLVNPAAGALITGLAGHLTSAIASVESTVTEAKSGPVKSAAVIADFQSALSLAGDITGKTFSYDAAALQTTIDAIVAAFNSIGAFKTSLKAQ
jgi:hypothetical protein